MRAWILAILAAVVLHVAILLFGGALFMKPEEDAATAEEVDLLESVDTAEEETTEVEAEPPAEIQVAQEAPPEMPDIAEPLPAIEPTDVVARLEALSLGALESALDPSSGGEAFGSGISLASGGRIGGTGALGSASGNLENAADAVFDIGALDQKPRLIEQSPPLYPAELRQKKIQGTVYVVFIVDRDGRVLDPAVETSPHEGLQAPALQAVRRWRFEPAVLRGEKVRSKMRIPIRFSLDG